ncbi:hypothetical protein M9435_002692 [Picochlorum sp. BPE23]|nr:hypothetical protein M9435_002692 [Picochlorum sp. BPE23]
MDKQGNIILYNAVERLEQDGQRLEKGLGQILVPYAQQGRVEVEVCRVKIVMSSIYKEMERVFLHSPHRVVSTFAVIKCTPVAQGPYGRKSVLSSGKKGRSQKDVAQRQQRVVPGSTKKPRVVCITVQRRAGSPGFKASLHVCKKKKGASTEGGGQYGVGYEIRKSFRLKMVSVLEAFGGAHPVCQVTFSTRKLSGGDVRVAFECVSEEERAELLGVVFSFCKSHEKVVPVLVGVKRRDLGVYGELSSSEEESDEEKETPVVVDTQRDEERTTSSSMDMQPTVPSVALQQQATVKHEESSGTVQKKKTYPSSIVGRKETAYSMRENIRADVLLDAVSEGASSLEDACRKISSELQALDDANIHELLESRVRSNRIHDGIFTTLGCLDDLEETIGMFELKLRHLKDDVAVIEKSSGYLENHSRNNALLLEAMNSLLDHCTLRPEVERVLLEQEMRAKYFDEMRVACEMLLSKIDAIHGKKTASRKGGLNSEFVNMKLVEDSLKRMKDIEKRFLKRAVDYFDSQVAPAPRETLDSFQEQLQLHEKIATLAPLLGLIAMVDAEAGKARVYRYLESTNSGLKKEVERSLGSLQVQHDMTGSKSIGKEMMKRVESATALERMHSSHMQKNRYASDAPVLNTDSSIEVSEISSAFSASITSLMPRITNEIAVLVDLLDKSGILIPHISAARSLVQGIGPEISQFLLSVKSSRGLSCLDIVGTIESFKVRLQPESLSGTVICEMLAEVLKDADGFWKSFVLEITEAIRKAPSARSGSSIHIFPFVANFESLANAMEAIAAEWVAKDGSMLASSDSQESQNPGTILPLSPFQSPQGSVEFDMVPQISAASSGSFSLPTSTPSQRIRHMADELYAKVLPSIFSAIESKTSDHDKHKERIRLENYAFLRISLQALPIKQSKVLKQYCTRAAEGRNASLKAYIHSILAENDLEALCDIPDSQKGKSIPSIDVAVFQPLIDDPDTFQSKLNAVRNRIKKDLGESASYLVNVVWERVDARVLNALDSLETMCSDSSVTDIRSALSSMRSSQLRLDI